MPITRRTAIMMMGGLGADLAGPRSLYAFSSDDKPQDTSRNLAISEGVYDLLWTSQSKNSGESMPCGGGDIGLNVWVENGDILFYMQRSGCFDELNGFPKLGRMRMRLEPSPFLPRAEFSQRLRLEDGSVEIVGTHGDAHTSVSIWVDVHSPVVHVETVSSRPTTVEVCYESWRTQEREDKPGEASGHRSWIGAPRPAVHYPDEISFQNNDIVAVHRNRDVYTSFDLCVEQQHLQSVKDQMWNPLRNLTFGAIVRDKNCVAAEQTDGQYASTPFRAWKLRSQKPDTQHDLRIYLPVAYTDSVHEWMTGAKRLISEDEESGTNSRERSKAWWQSYWQRSYINVFPVKARPQQAEWRVGRNYQIFRYQLACNAYGSYPTKFNGGMFTYDAEFVDPALKFDPDYRAWGGGSFTAQNQRLVYWPMLKSGDFDMMESQFIFYQRALRNAELRTEVYWEHKGASFTEQIENFGLPVAWEYGWDRPYFLDNGIQWNRYVDRLWETSLEFCLMILDVRRFTDADISQYLPLVHSCVLFFDEHYQQHLEKTEGRNLDQSGKFVFFPGTACETYKETLNSAVTIAALATVLRRLLEIGEPLVPKERHDYYASYLQRIPGLPFRTMKGRTTLAPAELFDRIQNVELPQLYPVFPYGIYGIGRPDLQIAIDTWHYGVENADQKNYISWHQDAIFCARLGLTEEAAAITIKKLDDSGRRCPTFWGPGHDWVPDHNWGGSGMIGLQEMLLQDVDDKLYLLPAWPKHWDVDFKLHAPHKTVVQGKLVDGLLKELVVTPHHRAKDVVLPAWCETSSEMKRAGQ